MEKTCGKCKGDKGFRTRKTTGVGQLIRGDTGWKTCPVCNGSGINPNYREKTCERCYRTIGYHKDAKYPPKYCQICKEKVAYKKAEKQRERERQNAMWREKACSGLKGSYCSKTIRYRVDWNNVPNLCPDCKAKAKSAKADRDAKMREKPCSHRGCPNMVSYRTDWEHPPSLCRSCNEKRKALQAQYPNINKSFVTTDTGYTMPGMKKTIGQMGGTKGKHYPRQGKIHCVIFEGMGGDDLHYSWDVDPITGDLIGEPYIHVNNPRG